MTRGELILMKLNRYEQRFKRAVLVDDTARALSIVSELDGYKEALSDLGYKITEDLEQAEQVKGYWISHWVSIESKI